MAPEVPLLVDGVFALANAGIYAHVGRALLARPVPPETRRPSNLFAVWWCALAVLIGLAGAARVLAAFGLLTAPLYIAMIHASLLVLCVAVCGLLYYLLFLLTGRHLLAPLAAAYVVVYAILVYYFASSRPTGFSTSGWALTLVYERPPGGWPLAAVLAAITLPQVAGAAAYLALCLRVDDPTQRYRIAMVAASICAWFASVLLASELRLADASWLAMASRLVGLGAALTLLYAYFPPAWVRRRWNIARVSDTGPRASP